MPEPGPSAETASADAILQKAMEYHEVGSFKKMLALLDEHQDLVGEMPEVAVLRLEQYMSDPQPDYRLMRSAASVILERDKNDANANYAMGLYWASLKKPDLGKALQHLALAKNAKKAPSGATGLYWQTFAKKYWYLFLLPLMAVAAVIDKRRKTPAGPLPVEAVPESGWRSLLSSLAERLKRLTARFRHRSPPPPDDGPGPNA